MIRDLTDVLERERERDIGKRKDRRLRKIDGRCGKSRRLQATGGSKT